jgi:hypothetical protein
MDWAERVSREDGETGGVNPTGKLRERNAARKERCATDSMTPRGNVVRNCVQHSPPVSTSGPPGAMTAVLHSHGISLDRFPGQVSVAVVAGVLLDHVHQHPAEAGAARAAPAGSPGAFSGPRR